MSQKPKTSKIRKNKKISPPKPRKVGQVVATQAMLVELRGEMKRDFASQTLEARVLRKEMNARFDKMQAEIEKVLAAVHRTSAIVEEQNARNKYVLDG